MTTAKTIATDITTETGIVIVRCIVRWIYDQVAELLQTLKEKLLFAIAFIDRQIDTLKLQLASLDILANLEERIWNIYQGFLDDLKNKLFGSIPGPDENLCPEFYEFILAPFRVLFTGYNDVFSIYRERWKNLLSFMDEVEYLLSYWESTKAYLVALVDVMDDAIYVALENAATKAADEMRAANDAEEFA